MPASLWLSADGRSVIVVSMAHHYNSFTTLHASTHACLSVPEKAQLLHMQNHAGSTRACLDGHSVLVA